MQELDKETQYILHQLNVMNGYKIACDMPTGVGEHGNLMPMAFQADVTITMGAYKEALYLDEAKDALYSAALCFDKTLNGMYKR